MGAVLVVLALGISSCTPDEETVLRFDVENLSLEATRLRVGLGLEPPRQFEANLVGRYQRLSLPLGNTPSQTITLGLEVLAQETRLGLLNQPFDLSAGFAPPVRLRIDEKGQPSIWIDGATDASVDAELTDAAVDGGATDAPPDASVQPDTSMPAVIRPQAQIWSFSGSRPVIDGRAEEVWMNALARGYDFTHLLVEDRVATPAARPKARWAALRDNLGLYVFVQVEDDSVVVDGPAGSAMPDDGKEPWEDDAVEIFLDGDRLPATGGLDDVNDSILQVRFGETLVRGPDPDRVSRVMPVPGYKVGWQHDSVGYSFEAFFPKQQLGVDTKPGQSILLDLHVNDDDAGDLEFKSLWKATWSSGQNQTFNNKALWGQGTFVAEALQPRVEIPRMAAPTIDGDPNDWSTQRWPLRHLFRPRTEPPGPLAQGDLAAELALGGDDEALYLMIEVTDDLAITGEFWPWFDDAVEIVFFPGDPAAGAVVSPPTRLFFRAATNKAEQPPYHNTEVDATRVSFAWQVISPTQRRLEVALPWSLWAQGPSQGVFGLEVVVWDDDEGEGVAKHRVGWMSKSEVPAVGPFPRGFLGASKLAPSR